MEKFWQLMEKSVIISGLIALVMVGTACYGVVAGVTLPDYFTLAFGLIIGYFFSEKVAKTQATIAASAASQARTQAQIQAQPFEARSKGH